MAASAWPAWAAIRAGFIQAIRLGREGATGAPGLPEPYAAARGRGGKGGPPAAGARSPRLPTGRAEDLSFAPFHGGLLIGPLRPDRSDPRPGDRGSWSLYLMRDIDAAVAQLDDLPLVDIQTPFPGQGAVDNEVDFVVPRNPAEPVLEFVGVRYDSGKIAGAARQFHCRYGVAGRPFDRGNDFPHGKAVSIAAIEDIGFASTAQMPQSKRMSGNKIAHMDVIAHARAIRCRIIRAVDSQIGMSAQRDLAGALDQMRGVERRLPRAAVRIGAGHVEVAENDI